MKLELNVQVTATVAFERIHSAYSELQTHPPFSLQELFNFQGFRLDEHCTQFSPHPQSNELQRIAEAFGTQYGIWIPSAKYFITCTLYLYPYASFDRMLTVVKNNAIDYYLNDTMGRDVYSFLSPAQQYAARRIVGRMARLDNDLSLHQSAHQVELANVEVLRNFQGTSPKDWFLRFLRLYSYHIGITHNDLNTNSQKYIPTIQDYIEKRNHTSGMHHIVLMMEYCLEEFLDWTMLRKFGFAGQLKRLHWIVAAFGALSNDLFSFEKEVIDNSTDNNLVAIIALNHPDLTFTESILWAASIVRDLLSEFMSLMMDIREKMNNSIHIPRELVRRIEMNLDCLDRCVQASWMWQVYTKRYKRRNSIWQETCLE